MSARYKNTVTGTKKKHTHAFAVPKTKTTDTFATDAFIHIVNSFTRSALISHTHNHMHEHIH